MNLDGRRRTGWRKRLLWALVGIVAIPAAFHLLAIAWLVLVPTVEDYVHRTEFDPAAWRNTSLDDNPLWPRRLRMVDDLIADKRLDGLTRIDVESLLGPGDDTHKWKDWHLVYHLGPERRGIRIDSEWLVIRFGPSAHVAEYRIVFD